MYSFIKENDYISIIEMNNGENSKVDDSNYNGRTGIVKHIDSAGQIHGTWGGLALVPEVDSFIVHKKALVFKGQVINIKQK